MNFFENLSKCLFYTMEHISKTKNTNSIKIFLENFKRWIFFENLSKSLFYTIEHD